MKFCVVQPEQIVEYWLVFKPVIEKIVDETQGEINIDLLHERLALGMELLLCVMDEDTTIQGVCIFNFFEFETGKKVLEMPYVGGFNMENWLIEGFDILKKLAIQHGCTHIRGCGRPGWKKIVPGLTPIRTVYEYDLST
jgi:hypothetical protein